MAPVIPEIDERLVKYLNEIFPDSLSLARRKDWSLEKAEGAREVIDLLLSHLNQQKEPE
jgi:hypothetical protein